MLVKIKQQKEISQAPLNIDTKIYNAYTQHNGIKSFIDLSTDVIVIGLYSFEDINDVVFDVVSTSKVEGIPTDSTSGSIVVTAESGDIQTYVYEIESLDYSVGKPILNSASNSVGECAIVSEPTHISPLISSLYVGTLAKPSSDVIDTWDVQEGDAVFLENSSDFSAIELDQLYNGSDKYLKVFRNIDAGGTDHTKFTYFRIIEKPSILDTAPVVVPTEDVYQNMIGLWINGTFIPAYEGIKDDVEDLYSQSDLETFLSDNNITNYTVTFEKIDTEFYMQNLDSAINWNKEFDKGFKLNDILSLDITLANKIIEISDRDFIPYWNLETLGVQFNSITEQYNTQLSSRKDFMSDRDYKVWEWFTMYLSDGNIPDVKYDISDYLTYSWFAQKLTDDDINFFKVRLEYMNNVFSDYKSDLSKSELLLIVNLFIVLERVIRSNSVLNLPSSTSEMSAKAFSDGFHKLKLKQPF
ncbi:hypothetical protein BPT24_002 [Tenacibaculum phage pT24]|uniref:Uncharacterized protein n=1 Tax=Tenacibaculum phage pT24 TaxID=1880590 RepID=A0A1B4XWG4_9CAUD|nr:hypothetical protein HYP10_gp002 [Tenacibaculum phage pT24]BAV39124.1 hypothetical protein BPT24_002 [Tenacibaculum phage pT24]